MKQTDQQTPTRSAPPAVPEVVIEDPAPLVEGGRFPVKAVIGDPLAVSATVFTHGHTLVRAVARIRRVGARRWTETPLVGDVNDHYSGEVIPTGDGPFEIEIAAATDDLASFVRDARRRLDAGQQDRFDAEILADLLSDAAGALSDTVGNPEATKVDELARSLRRGLSAEGLEAIAPLEPLLARRALPAEGVATVRLKGFATRERAAFSSWYELFPRSASPDRSRPGTLSDATARLEYIAGLGFDVVYLPPIHPIGRTARKGKGNTTVAERDDVGSPWAIGSDAGGHNAIAPELGSLADFDELVANAQSRGLEVALDLAFQCSPDHPWVAEHPDWFRHRPDGSIACAENPPKRYDDIYPLDFHTRDREGLWQALAGVAAYWANRGVRIFRVDNPHTKPFAFWEWMIAEIKREHPGTLFLSEAFTRPAVMHRLAKVGFDQSYTYFTWRDERWELEQYFRELTSRPGVDYFRPNVWPNTPDILAKSLQHGGRASFLVRLVLAAGLSANYGIYGPVFELLWDEPASPGSEEYRASEKYEVHFHDLDDPTSIAGMVARVNAARRANAALQRNDGLVFHPVDNEQVVAWSKCSRSRESAIGIVNLDPRWTQAGFVDIDPGALGLPGVERFMVRDALTDERYVWSAGRNFVKLDPGAVPAHLLLVEGPA